MPLAVALLNGKMVSDAPKVARPFFFSYVAKSRADPGEDLMLLKAKSLGDLDFANYPPLGWTHAEEDLERGARRSSSCSRR